MEIEQPRFSPRIRALTGFPLNERATAPAAGETAIHRAGPATRSQPLGVAVSPVLVVPRPVCLKGAFAMQRPLVAWDLETKGVGRHQDRIIEFGAVKRFADARPDEIKLLRFKPPFYVSPHILAAHNISLRDFCRAPPFAARAAEITTFLAGCDFVGHNLKRFDIPMLGAALGRAQGKTWGIDFDWPAPDTRVLDTLDLFRRFMPDKVRAGGNHKLGTCYAFYTGRPLINAHSAVADSQACMDVAFAMAAASATGVAVGLGHGQMHTTIEDLDAYGRSLTAAQSARSGSEAQRVTQAID